MDKLEIGIVETRNIIKSIKEKYNYDFSDHALTSFKRRLANVMALNRFEDADTLIKQIEEDIGFFDEFLYDISVETSEMFRDPSLWRVLRDVFIPKLLSESENPRIWVAGDSTGEELYSLAILLKESGWLDKVEIFMSYICHKQLDKIQQGWFNSKKIEVNDANYTRFNGNFNLSGYYTNRANGAFWDTSLIKNVNFIKQNIIFDDSPKRIRLILFRNNMIYYNQVLQDKILQKIIEGLVPAGFLVIGDKESLTNSTLCDDFVLANNGESIYKKKAI